MLCHVLNVLERILDGRIADSEMLKESKVSDEEEVLRS